MKGTVLRDSRRTVRKGAVAFLAGATVLLFLAANHLAAGTASGHTISWNHPKTFQDGSGIDASSRATIVTKLYFSRDGRSWTHFASVGDGGESWTGELPVPVGSPAYYGATATLPGEGVESPLSDPFLYPSRATLPGSVSPQAERFDEVTVSFGGGQDTYVATGDGETHSGSPLIRTYVWPARSVANRGFLRWDVSSIPPDARITGATLRLYYADEEEGGVDNAFAVSVAKVIGANLDPSTATWNSPDGVSSWSGGANGGERNLAPGESTAVVGNSHDWVVWNVTGMVRDWVKTPAANFGMALEPAFPGTADGNRYFASGEYPEPHLRPELVVTYLRSPQALGPPPPAASGGGAFPGSFMVSVGGLEDTYLNMGSYSDASYAADPWIGTYTWPENHVANRGLMRWDLSGLPAGVTVMNASLWLYHVADGGGGLEYNVGIAKVTGVQPDLDRATWNRFDGVSPWPGGGNGGAAAMGPHVSSAVIGRTSRWVSWDVTDLAQEWVDRPENNFGMVIDGDASAYADSYRYFASGEHPDPSLRPRLLVTFASGP